MFMVVMVMEASYGSIARTAWILFWFSGYQLYVGYICVRSYIRLLGLVKHDLVKRGYRLGI